jgi:hypothetical protein
LAIGVAILILNYRGTLNQAGTAGPPVAN